MRIVVADRSLERFSDVLEEPVEGGSFTYCDPQDEAALLAALPAAGVFVGSRLTADQVAIARSLRLVQAAGAGTDKLATSALGPAVQVANVFEHEGSIAEHVVMVMLALRRDLLRADAHLRRGRWLSAAQDHTVGLNRALDGQVLGLVGYGHIGQAVARVAAALGMRVQAVRRTPSVQAEPPLDFLGGPQDLPRILRESDVVVVTVPLTESTRGLLGAEELALMHPSALLVNVARGPVVDEQALYAALVERRIAGAAIDVWYADPPPEGAVRLPASAPFGELPNVVLTPHYSGVTDATFRRRARAIGENIARLAAGQEIHNRLA